MATRVSVAGGTQPDPVEQEDNESPAETAAVANTAPSFVDGTRALFKRGRGGKSIPLDDEDEIEVVNVSLTNARFRVRDNATKKAKGGFGERTVLLKPFESLKIRVGDARRRFTAQERQGGNPIVLVVPQDGDCGGHTFRSQGKQFNTCPYLNCKTCGPAPQGVKWSIWQIQHRISRLGTEAAINRIIQTVDSRPQVVAWGLEVSARRKQSRALGMGLSVTNRTVVY